MNKPIVSVIVAVYNAENTLKRCLDSVIHQTLKNIEIIVIDDGSTDMSGKICDEYAQRDCRVNVIHKKNEGIAVARQIGTEEAHGKYSIHLDADDWIEPDMYEKLYNKAESVNADITICDMLIINPDGGKYVLKQELDCSDFESAMMDFLKFKVNSGLCNKLIEHNLYHKYGIKSNPTLTTSEDFFVLCQLFVHQPRIAYVAEPLYIYDKSANPQSISKKTSRSHLESLIFCLKYIEQHIDNKKFESGLNARKMFLKNWMWESNIVGRKVFVETYKEVNLLFKNETRKKRGLYSPIYYALNGHYWFGQTLRYLYALRAGKLR